MHGIQRRMERVKVKEWKVSLMGLVERYLPVESVRSVRLTMQNLLIAHVIRLASVGFLPHASFSRLWHE